MGLPLSLSKRQPMTDMHIDNRAIFLPLSQHIEKEEYHDTDMFQLIGDYAVVAPHIARALALHTRDLITEEGDGDMTWTDIVVQVWYRAFFSPTHAALYGTQQMVHDPIALTNFVKYVIDPTSVNADDVVIKAIPVHH
jgi:hypothetical protein